MKKDVVNDPCCALGIALEALKERKEFRCSSPWVNVYRLDNRQVPGPGPSYQLMFTLVHDQYYLGQCLRFGGLRGSVLLTGEGVVKLQIPEDCFDVLNKFVGRVFGYTPKGILSKIDSNTLSGYWYTAYQPPELELLANLLRWHEIP